MPSPSHSTEVRRARPLLGTLVEVRAAGAMPRELLHAAVDAAFAAVEQVHHRMSFHEAGSTVSALNREALRRPLPVDAQTWAVLAAAQRLSRLSEGAFDIAVGAPLRDWGYLPSVLPEPAGPPFAGNWTDIELLDDCRVRFHRPLLIDLGGIAKGYAVDCAVAALRQAGVPAALVNAGGDLRSFGGPQQVQLRHAQAPARAAYALTLCDEALATSANYFSRRVGATGEVSPLLDPRRRKPWLGAASVSVRAAECISADALTKVVLFAAPEAAERVLATYGAQAYVQQPSAAAA